MTMIDHEAIKLAIRNQILSALPATRVWENDTLVPAQGVEYVQETFLPNGRMKLGLTVDGVVQDDFLYVLTWYGLAGSGTHGLNASLYGVLDLVHPGTTIVTGSTVIRVKGNPKPFRSQILNPVTQPGRAVASVTIPVRVYSQNS